MGRRRGRWRRLNCLAEGMREWVKTGQDEGEVCGRAGEGVGGLEGKQEELRKEVEKSF